MYCAYEHRKTFLAHLEPHNLHGPEACFKFVATVRDWFDVVERSVLVALVGDGAVVVGMGFAVVVVFGGWVVVIGVGVIKVVVKFDDFTSIRLAVIGVIVVVRGVIALVSMIGAVVVVVFGVWVVAGMVEVVVGPMNKKRTFQELL